MSLFPQLAGKNVAIFGKKSGGLEALGPRHTEAFERTRKYGIYLSG